MIEKYINKVIWDDCLNFMNDLPDKCIPLCLTDVPYGINITSQNLGEGGGVYKAPKGYKKGEWDDESPSKEYFDEMIRISKNQIFFGANHFISKIPYDSACWIFWDKNNGDSDFADGELAWTSFKSPLRKFKFTWSGMIQEQMGKLKEKRFHPTQKPVKLLEWIIQKYSNEEDIILDPFAGSGSLGLACLNTNRKYILVEKDEDYYKIILNRISKKGKSIKEFI